jgi:hypothetical protein
MTSDSANTVHMLLMLAGLRDARARPPNASVDTSNAFAVNSKNLPVPAAHLSFIKKFTTFPFSTAMTLLS